MAIRTHFLGGSDWQSGEILYANDLNNTIGSIYYNIKRDINKSFTTRNFVFSLNVPKDEYFFIDLNNAIYCSGSCLYSYNKDTGSKLLHTLPNNISRLWWNPVKPKYFTFNNDSAGSWYYSTDAGSTIQMLDVSQFTTVGSEVLTVGISKEQNVYAVFQKYSSPDHYLYLAKYTSGSWQVYSGSLHFRNHMSTPQIICTTGSILAYGAHNDDAEWNYKATIKYSNNNGSSFVEFEKSDPNHNCYEYMMHYYLDNDLYYLKLIVSDSYYYSGSNIVKLNTKIINRNDADTQIKSINEYECIVFDTRYTSDGTFITDFTDFTFDIKAMTESGSPMYWTSGSLYTINKDFYGFN